MTREGHGLLATDLELLLEREPGDPYPWVISVLDRETLANGWRFLGLTDEQLREYLQLRVELHGRVFSSDELDYVGSFLKHGAAGLRPKSEDELIFLNPNYSGLFDAIYDHLHYGAPAPDLTERPPALIDVRRSLAEGNPVRAPSEGKLDQRVGRNEPCVCVVPGRRSRSAAGDLRRTFNP